MSKHAEWTEPLFKENGADNLAMKLLESLHGLSVGQVRRVLHQAEKLLDATTVLDCSATSFQQAAEGYRHASGE